MTEMWIAYGALALSGAGALCTALVWVHGQIRALEASVRAEVKTERENTDRVFARREDLARLEARFDSFEGLLREVRNAVVQRPRGDG